MMGSAICASTIDSYSTRAICICRVGSVERSFPPRISSKWSSNSLIVSLTGIVVCIDLTIACLHTVKCIAYPELVLLSVERDGEGIEGLWSYP